MSSGTAAALERSTDMVPVQGTVDVAIPRDTLWECFVGARSWPAWNPCFFWVRNARLARGDKLVWAFQPIRPWYLYKMPATANIVELEPGARVTWEVTILPGFFARHTYHMESLPDGRTRFGSWEQAMGWGFRATSWFWIPHFQFVCNASLDGARKLERVFQAHQRLDDTVLRSMPVPIS